MSAIGLVEVLHALEGILDRLGLERSYGGAIAYNYYGPPRLTQDVDVLVLIPDLKAPALVEALAAAGYRHGEVSPQSIELRAVLGDLRGKAHLATFVVEGVRVEIFTPWHSFHRRVLERSPERDFAGRVIRIHTAEDLIVFKKIFDRPKDWMDIKAMLLTQQGRLDFARIRQEARPLLTDDSFRELERLLDEYGGAAAPP